MAGRIYVGTSGWSKDWAKAYFPEDVPQRRYLEYLGKKFSAIEINATFYRNQSPETFAKWAGEVPPGFQFAVKASRYLTHVKRLTTANPYWRRFAKPTAKLGTKRGPFLVQLPPSFRAKEETPDRLDTWLTDARRTTKTSQFAFEFRHESCFVEPVFKVLRKHRAALVLSDAEKFPTPPVIATAPFVYARLRLTKPRDAAVWAKRLRAFRKDGKTVFAFAKSAAGNDPPKNAETLQRLLG
jgi:uncharacterized protein YecE (DUF72 family)